MSHIRTHTLEKPYKCGVCDKEFLNSYVRSRHEKTHADKKHKCHLCTYAYHGVEDLRSHLSRHENEKRFICLFCSYRTATKSDMFQHTKSHLKEHPNFCKSCGWEFRRPDALKYHEVNCHAVQ